MADHHGGWAPDLHRIIVNAIGQTSSRRPGDRPPTPSPLLLLGAPPRRRWWS